MVTRTTRNAAECRPRAAGPSFHRTTAGTRLEAVRRQDLDEDAPRPCELVSQKLDEKAKTCVEDAPIEPGLASTAVGGHSFDAQGLDDHRAVALGVGGPDFVPTWLRWRRTLRWSLAILILAFSSFFDPFFRLQTTRSARAARARERLRCCGFSIVLPSLSAARRTTPRSSATTGSVRGAGTATSTSHEIATNH